MPRPWDLLNSWNADRIASLNPIAATSDDQVVDGTPGGEQMRSDGHDDVTLNGHDGDDFLMADGGTGGEFNGGAGDDYVGAGLTGEGFEQYPQNTGGVFNGGDGDDLLDANESSGGTFNGGNGNDVLGPGAAYSGTLNGDAGDDFIYGDRLEAPGRTFVFDGGTGNDTALFEYEIGDYYFAKHDGTVVVTMGSSDATVSNIEKFWFLNAEHTGWQEYSLDEIPCFLPGTRIATPSGEVPIETLKAGDLVLTSDGEARPVRWLARQSVSTVFANPLQVMPILVRAGALGENLPARDLYISPDHALFLDGLLVHGGALVNGSSIVRHTAMPEHFTYYHVELDDHSLILAEGTPVETFIDNVTRQSFDNWQDAPEAPVAAELELPRIKAARQLSPHIHNWLAIRTKVLGYAEEAA